MGARYIDLPIVEVEQGASEDSSVSIEVRLPKLLLDGHFENGNRTEVNEIFGVSKIARACGLSFEDTIDSQTRK